MTGGSATQAGIGFQNKVAAFVGVYILADARAEFLGLPGTAVPTRIELETSAPIDDILVSTSDAGLCFINVKKSVTISKRQNSHLGSVVDQFVRFELNHDGFRALAHVDGRECTLVSRRRHVYRQFPQLQVEIAHSIRVHSAVLDGEIVCLGSDGRSLFNRLLFRRDWPHFYRVRRALR